MIRRRGEIGAEAKNVLSISHLYFPSLSLLLVLLGVTAWVPQPEPIPLDRAYPWLYLRDGKALAAKEQVVELMAVGDVMLGREVAGEADPLADVTPWLRSADLVLGNLECVIGAGGAPRPGPYRLHAPLSAAGILHRAGFDVLGLANNHALDYGSQGLAGTVSALQQAGIDALGAGPDPQTAAQPLIREAGGLRVAFLAFNALPPDAEESGWTWAAWDKARATTAIAAAQEQADVVIVSIHWGYEYELRPDPAQRDAARAMLDAGADLVIGHHPHVVQGSEIRGGGLVAYSLGNLVFDQQGAETGQGLVLRAFIDRQGLRAVQALPVWAGPHPRLMGLEQAEPLLNRVQPPPERLGFACNTQTCWSVDVPQTFPAGPFRAGAIDLTGDGAPERVRLLDGQVAIDQEGIEVWRGLPEWQVVDLALGDPNDDGRGELLLALWKPDAEGVPRSHPFLVGYREGAYRILWGGSAVPDPIREVELGDMDGDGVQELIVLEDRDGSRHVTVWRWHGWGFSLAWRSPAGPYRDLALLSGPEGSPPIISVGSAWQTAIAPMD